MPKEEKSHGENGGPDRPPAARDGRDPHGPCLHRPAGPRPGGLLRPPHPPQAGRLAGRAREPPPYRPAIRPQDDQGHREGDSALGPRPAPDERRQAHPPPDPAAHRGAPQGPGEAREEDRGGNPGPHPQHPAGRARGDQEGPEGLPDDRGRGQEGPRRAPEADRCVHHQSGRDPQEEGGGDHRNLNSTVVEISLPALRHNLRQVARRVGTVSIIAVVKANAYGHGVVPVTRTLLTAGAHQLGVATVAEGQELRHAGITAPILVMGGIFPDDVPLLQELNLTPVLPSRDAILMAARLVKSRSAPLPVHLKVDTGMSRLGLAQEEFLGILRSSWPPTLRLDGLMSHLASADSHDGASAENQLARFRELLDAAKSAGLAVPAAHIANSAAILRFPASYFDLVRPGLMLYGYVTGRRPQLISVPRSRGRPTSCRSNTSARASRSATAGRSSRHIPRPSPSCRSATPMGTAAPCPTGGTCWSAAGWLRSSGGSAWTPRR